MGQHLVMGVATEIRAYRKSSRYIAVYTNEQILDSTKVHFDLGLYNMKETDDAIEFYIKPDIFVEHIYDFIVEQTALFTDEKLKDNISEILQSRDYERIIAEGKRRCHFSFSDIQSSFTTAKDVDIRYEGFVYFVSGKTYMDFCGEFLTYFRNLVHASSKNPLRGTVVPDFH